MDGRTSLLAFSFLIGCNGCFLADSFKGTPPTPKPAAEYVSPKGKDRTFTPATIVRVASLNEDEAKRAENDPPMQFKIRDQARKAYQEALRLDPNHVDAWRGLARVYVQMEDYDKALDTFRKATQKLPNEPALWIDMGMMHNRRKNFEEGNKCLQKALEIDPENREAKLTLGLNLARTGKMDQSLKMLTQAVGNAAAHYNLARMCLHLGKEQEARVHLVQSIEANPRMVEARETLAALDKGELGKQGDIQQAGHTQRTQ